MFHQQLISTIPLIFLFIIIFFISFYRNSDEIIYGTLGGLIGGYIGGLVGGYHRIRNTIPIKIGFSKNQIHIRYMNDFYNIDLDTSNIQRVSIPWYSNGRTIKIHLKTGTVKKVVGPKKLMTKIIHKIQSCTT